MVRLLPMAFGRFAPSPTSDLHLGNLRTALLAWQFARDAGLGFLVRIEDLDQQRVAAAGAVADQQLNDLAALGIDWDAEPVRQSDRLDLYRTAAARLDSYECFCTRREIAEAAQAPHGSYRPYPGTCATLTDAQRAQRRLERPAAIRVRAGGVEMTAHDRHAGAVRAVVDDFVLFRADGTPAYNLAVVVDDALQQITQVCRGADLLASAPRQAWLAEQLGYPPPSYLHVGMVLNTRGDRLAKRDGAVTLGELAAHGWTAADVCELLCVSAGLPAARSAPDLLAATRGIDWQADAIWRDWRLTVGELLATRKPE